MPLAPTKMIDGDTDFRGFRSRQDPVTLPPGIARYAQNMRTGRERRPRPGTLALATDLEIDNPPAVLDFALPTEIAVISITRSGSTATVTIASDPGWLTGDVVGIEGADQPEYNGDFQITVLGAGGGGWQFTYAVSGTPATPATGTIVAAKGLRIFEVYADRVRAACVFTEDDNTERVLIAAGNRAYVYRQGESSLEIDYPAGETIGANDEAALETFLNKVYLFRGRAAGPKLTIASITRSTSTVTVTASAAHGLATGDWVRLPNAAEEDYRGVWQITVTAADEFTYDIGAATPTSPSAAPGVCYQVRPVLVWDRNAANDFVTVTTGGAPEVLHIRMPPADWGLAYNRQIWLPYGRDEGIVSDFGVDNVFDTQLAQFRIRPGGNDWLVAMHPLSLTRQLVFYRKSAHLLALSSANLGITGVQERALEKGCVSRQSIATYGDRVLWLSDAGIEQALITTELNIVAGKEPLSAPIEDIIKRINWSQAHRAVAMIDDNRYKLAVPLDDSEVNNRILVFNFLNVSPDAPLGEWEAMDIYPGDWDVVAFLQLDYGGRQRLHAVTSLGFLYLLDEGEQDQYGVPGGILGNYDIEGIVRGRHLFYGTLEAKRYRKVIVAAEFEVGAQMQVDVVTVDPDTTRRTKDHVSGTTEDKTLKAHLRQRGVSGAVDIVMPKGRPTLKAYTLEAVAPGADMKDKE